MRLKTIIVKKKSNTFKKKLQSLHGNALMTARITYNNI